MSTLFWPILASLQFLFAEFFEFDDFWVLHGFARILGGYVAILDRTLIVVDQIRHGNLLPFDDPSPGQDLRQTDLHP